MLDVVVDDEHGLTRKYAVPGRHRCQECHQGGDDGSFVLGFTPLQINRRPVGGGGRDQPVGPDELAQVSRLSGYGVLKGVDAATALPKLESFPTERYLDDHTLRAQGYALGNCAHCHTPEGFAMKTNNVKLNLTAGEIFRFNTKTRSKDYSNRYFVDNEGDLAKSYLYFRVSAPHEQQGLLSPMPLHTAGGPDCKALTLLGKWIQTYNKNLTPAQIEAFKPAEKCTPNDQLNAGAFPWIEEDFTGGDSANYVPRRQDWADTATGMPAAYRALTLSPELKKIIETPYPVAYWEAKPECRFPAVDLPAAERRPWMVDDAGQPTQPFGELYTATPGAWFFTTTCSKCHGDKGAGDGQIGRSLAIWSGGEVRVANFMSGMFGNAGRNLATFDVAGQTDAAGGPQNLAPQYLIWMAMEGTKINVPPQAEKYLGKHKAQMLRQIKERCSRMIPTSPKASSPRFAEHEIFRDICLAGNLPADTPEIQFDPNTDLPANPAAHEAWLDRGALNAGWAIYQYLHDRGARGLWQPRQSECEKEYAAPAP